MNKEQFIDIWNLLDRYNKRSKELYKTGINLVEYDKTLYNGIIMLLKTIFESQAKVDFIIFSIFSEDKYIEELGEEINTAELCWNHLNNI